MNVKKHTYFSLYINDEQNAKTRFEDFAICVYLAKIAYLQWSEKDLKC